MNIVIVSDFAHVNGGNAAVALASATGLAQQGHSVTIFAGVGPVGPEIAASPVMVVSTNQQAIGDDRRRTRAVVQGIWNVKAASMMTDLLGRMDVRRTVVHVHGWDKALSSSVVRAVVDVTDSAPTTRPERDRIGTAQQMIPGSCSSRSQAWPRWRIACNSASSFARLSRVWSV